MEDGLRSEGAIGDVGGLTFFMDGAGGDALRYSSEDVYRALNSYQLYLDQWMGVDQFAGGKIRVREIVEAYRYGKSDEWVRSKCAVVRIVSKDSSGLVGEDYLPPYEHDDHGGWHSGGAPGGSVDNEAPWAWQHWMKAGLVLWACYVFFGIFFYLFVLRNPDFSFFGILGSASISLIQSSLVVFVCIFPILKISLFVFDLFSDDDRVVGFLVFVGLVAGAWVGSASYRTGYEHMLNNQLAPLDVLFDRCLKRGLAYGERVGAVCVDGRRSGATGSGACSHHGGVAYWRRDQRQTKSHGQCRMEASDISWRWKYEN